MKALSDEPSSGQGSDLRSCNTDTSITITYSVSMAANGRTLGTTLSNAGCDRSGRQGWYTYDVRCMRQAGNAVGCEITPQTGCLRNLDYERADACRRCVPVESVLNHLRWLGAGNSHMGREREIAGERPNGQARHTTCRVNGIRDRLRNLVGYIFLVGKVG